MKWITIGDVLYHIKNKDFEELDKLNVIGVPNTDEYEASINKLDRKLEEIEEKYTPIRTLDGLFGDF